MAVLYQRKPLGITVKKTNPRICILRTDRIGDVVLTLPMAAVIKAEMPEAHITFAVRAYTADIPANSQYVDTVSIIEPGAGIKQISRQLRQGNFDCIFIVSPHFSVSMAAFLAGIPVRIGTSNRWYSFLFNKRIADHRSEVKFHEAEYNVRMLSALGLEASLTRETAKYGLTVPAKIQDETRALLEGLGITGEMQYCVVHPGSGGSAVDFPEENFATFIRLLRQNTGMRVILTGKQDERALCERIGNNENIVLAGKLSLPQLMGIIGKSFIFVSNSTGPLHIAAALGRLVIGFYPKIRVCSAERWGPYTTDALVFKPSIPCADCTKGQCRKLDCMRSIDPEYVVQQFVTFQKTIDRS